MKAPLIGIDENLDIQASAPGTDIRKFCIRSPFCVATVQAIDGL